MPTNELSETIDRACMVITEASLTMLALRAEVDRLREGLFTIARGHPETRDTVTRDFGSMGTPEKPLVEWTMNELLAQGPYFPAPVWEELLRRAPHEGPSQKVQWSKVSDPTNWTHEQ